MPCLREAGADLRALGDLGYEGESSTITVAFKNPQNSRLAAIQQQSNKTHNSLRIIGERGKSLLKTTFKAPRNISLDQWRIGKIVAAALVLLHTDQDRTHDHHWQSERCAEWLVDATAQAVIACAWPVR
ncbi:transposase family protein [Micromonospora sp. NPDC050276]|uniref:transposase family protein n=1 Tax=Micromonospora sp. NPDC050276 TaxID=3364278 RepID=UPI00378BE79A